MIDQIIEFNIMSPLLGDGYKAGGIGEIRTHPLVPKDIVVFKSLPLEKQEEIRKKYDFWKYQ